MPRSRTRVRCEDGLRIDLNRLIREGLARPGHVCRSSIFWTSSATGARVAEGAITAHMRGPRGLVELETDGGRQEVAIEAEPRHLGGHQWYFLCPRTGVRASVLWRPYGATYFASRQAWTRRVAYGAQFETKYNRAISRAQDIRCELGGKEWVSLFRAGNPPKPKGMHWRTYNQKIQQSERYISYANQHLAACIGLLK